MARRTKKTPKSVETLTHGEASRRNIPTAEVHPVMAHDKNDRMMEQVRSPVGTLASMFDIETAFA